MGHQGVVKDRAVRSGQIDWRKRNEVANAYRSIGSIVMFSINEISLSTKNCKDEIVLNPRSHHRRDSWRYKMHLDSFSFYSWFLTWANSSHDFSKFLGISSFHDGFMENSGGAMKFQVGLRKFSGDSGNFEREVSRHNFRKFQSGFTWVANKFLSACMGFYGPFGSCRKVSGNSDGLQKGFNKLQGVSSDFQRVTGTSGGFKRVSVPWYFSYFSWGFM